MYPEDNTTLPSALGPTPQPDAIDHLLEAALAGQPITPVLVRSAGVVDTGRGQHHAWVESPYLGRATLLLALAAGPLEPLNGYQFTFWGLRVDPALPVDDGPRWALPLPGRRGLYVRFLRQSLRWQHSAIWADRLTLPNVPPLDLLSGLEQPHTAQEREAAWRGLALLSEHARRQAAGQKRLEAKRQHPWREVAERAEELQREHPTWGNRKLARQLGMLGREETLRLWRKRLAENG